MLTILMSLCGAVFLFSLFMMKRNCVIFAVRERAINVIYERVDEWKSLNHYLYKVSYEAQMWEFSKWSFEDFFPELAAIEQERNSK